MQRVLAVDMVKKALYKHRFLHFPSHYLLKWPLHVYQGYQEDIRLSDFLIFFLWLPDLHLRSPAKETSRTLQVFNNVIPVTQ